MKPTVGRVNFRENTAGSTCSGGKEALKREEYYFNDTGFKILQC